MCLACKLLNEDHQIMYGSSARAVGRRVPHPFSSPFVSGFEDLTRDFWEVGQDS